MGFKFLRLTEDGAFHMNVGVPILISLIFLYANVFIFGTYFVDLYGLLLYFYFISSLLFLLVNHLISKYLNKKEKKFQVNYYLILVVNSMAIVFFLMLNVYYSELVFEKTINKHHEYVFPRKKLDVPNEYKRIFRVNRYELSDSKEKGNYLHVEINESIFGYKIVVKREFVKEME